MELYVAPRHRRAIRARKTNRWGRRALAVAVLAAFVYLLLACVGPAPAKAQDLLDPRLGAQRESLRQQAAATYWCAYDGTMALVRAGARDEMQVVRTLGGWCGRGLVVALQQAPTSLGADEAMLYAARVINRGFEDARRAMTQRFPAAGRKPT